MHHILALLLVGISVLMAGDPPPPMVLIEPVRSAIEGRRVSCFAVSATDPLTAAITVTLAYGGSATRQTDYEAPLTITLPNGLRTDQAIFVAISSVIDPDNSGETIDCTIQASANYGVAPGFGSASVSVLDAFADNSVEVLGEPIAVQVANAGTWTYDLHLRRPAQVPLAPDLVVVKPYRLIIEAAPGAAAAPNWISVGPPTLSGDDLVFRITAVPNPGAADSQVRFRMTAQVDVDGDQNFTPSGSPTTNGQPSQDVFRSQDVVLAIGQGGTS